MTEEIKLRPCPFCGEDARIERYGNPRQSTQYICDHCGASLETGEEWEHGRDWNRRPIEDGLRLRVIELEKKIEDMERTHA